MSGLKVEIIEINGKPGRKVLENWFCDGVTIPAGFEFDGASSPRIFWRIVPPFRNLEASCKHDWDCNTARLNVEAGRDIRAHAIRRKADKDYAARIKKFDGALIGYIAWLGVRVGSLIGSGW